MKIWRIEHGEKSHGMWYNENGVYQPFIMTLTEGKSAHLPMEEDERYRLNNKFWHSGCYEKEMLKHWFTDRDVVELGEGGFKLFEMESAQFIMEPEFFQVLYTVEGIRNKVELPLSTLYQVV